MVCRKITGSSILIVDDKGSADGYVLNKIRIILHLSDTQIIRSQTVSCKQERKMIG